MKIIFKLLFFITISQGNSEFIISYKAIIKDQILIGEEFNIVKALTRSKEYSITGGCDFIPNNMDIESKLIDILKINKEMVLECLEKNINAKITDDTKFINNEVSSKTKFEFLPHRILADIKNNRIDIQFIKKIR